ncbi:MAG: hypothetical protein H0V47_05290 [Chloroflexia bacterium]|nr:hypothetical protein [Chloroflexia bacterium]
MKRITVARMRAFMTLIVIAKELMSLGSSLAAGLVFVAVATHHAVLAKIERLMNVNKEIMLAGDAAANNDEDGPSFSIDRSSSMP